MGRCGIYMKILTLNGRAPGEIYKMNKQLRPVLATKTWRYRTEDITHHGWHHLFYADADNEPSIIMEDQDGEILHLCLTYWKYQFTDRQESTPQEACRDLKG